MKRHIRVHVWLALAALAVGFYSYGGYHRSSAVAFACAAGVALVWAFVAEPPRASDLTRFTGAIAGIGAVALARGIAGGHPTAGLGYGLLCATAIALFLTAKRTTRAEAEALEWGTLALVGVEAVVGIVAVARHSEPLAFAGLGAWRASTTLTYPNAAAAVFGPAALVALDRSVRMAPDHRDPPAGRARHAQFHLGLLLAALLLSGSVATLSRAAPLGLLVGLLVMTKRRGPTQTLRVTIPAACGMAVVILGLLPSVPRTAPPAPGWAAAGAIGAVIVTLGAWQVSSRLGTRALVFGSLLVAIPIAAIALSGITQRGGLAASSSDRRAEAGAAVEEFRRAPLIGVGPNQATLQWQDEQGRRFQAKYAHNEFLQVAAELGAIGLALLAFALWSGWTIVVQGGPKRSTDPIADFAAPLACFTFHMTQDYVAHFTAVIALMAAWVGLAARRTGGGQLYREPI